MFSWKWTPLYLGPGYGFYLYLPVFDYVIKYSRDLLS